MLPSRATSLACALAVIATLAALTTAPDATAASRSPYAAARTGQHARHPVRRHGRRARRARRGARRHHRRHRSARHPRQATTRASTANRAPAVNPDYQNPVYTTGDAPDPYVLDDGGTHTSYFAFVTGNLFPILHSSDLVHWTAAGNALLSRPVWTTQANDWHPWAPSVLNVSAPCPGTSSNGCYVMYYVGLSAEFNANCVGVATATAAGGPYTDQGPLSNGHLDAAGHPIGCGDEHGYGMIDPSPFLDPTTGRLYLYASEDFACSAAATECNSSDSTLQPTISVIPLAGDGMSAIGPRTALMSAQPGTWEAANVGVPTVEGPNVLLHNGVYYLLYSGGSWRNQYGMGYATAPSPSGPFTRSDGNPILSQTASVFSPGGGDTPVVGPHGGLWVAYHGRAGSYTSPRTLRIDPFSWQPTGTGIDAPAIAGPTSTPQSVNP